MATAPATFPAANFPLSIVTGLGADQFLLAGISGREAISEPFHYELELLADPSLDVPFDKVLGAPATVTLRGPGKTGRHVSGIISRFRQDDADETHAYFRAELVPHLWLLTRSIQSRVFQQLSVLDILKRVLQSVNVSWNLTRTYSPINYCVQYRETDLAFASRLMEAAGIYYYFRHESDKDVLVVSDQTQTYPHLPEPATLTYNRTKSMPDHAFVTAWSKAQAVATSRYAVDDYHFEVSQHKLSGSASPTGGVAVGSVTHSVTTAGASYAVVDYPGGYASRYDGIGPNGEATSGLQGLFDEPQQAANLWMQREVCSCFELRGQSTYANLQPGYQVQLERHPNANGNYLLTGVSLDARMSGFRSGSEIVLAYKNDFECLPAALVYRPPLRTPKPVISGPQTAVVTGTDANVPFVDKYGRVKVQFHWDVEGKKDALTSCWVRVGQIWAGAHWGATFWPRPGHEVVVAFEQGDPDRPLIVGSVYNDHNMPPYALPKDAYVSGIKSCSISASANADKHQLHHLR